MNISENKFVLITHNTNRYRYHKFYCYFRNTHRFIRLAPSVDKKTILNTLIKNAALSIIIKTSLPIIKINSNILISAKTITRKPSLLYD